MTLNRKSRLLGEKIEVYHYACNMASFSFRYGHSHEQRRTNPPVTSCFIHSECRIATRISELSFFESTCFPRLGFVVRFVGFQSAVLVVLGTIVSQCAIGCFKLNFAFVVLACCAKA